MTVSKLLLLLLATNCLCQNEEIDYSDEATAQQYLVGANNDIAVASSKLSFAAWDYNTNITQETAQNYIEATAIYYTTVKGIWNETIKYNYINFTDASTRRQFEKLSILGTGALSDEDSNALTTVSTEMESTYSSAKVCVAGVCDLSLEPDLTQIMAEDRDWDKLQEAWKNWRDASGKPIRQQYLQYVELGNKAAKLNGFDFLDDLWMSSWDVDKQQFKDQLENLWEEIKPLYDKLHAFVRMKLNDMYGKDKMPLDGTIPAHLLGNMWAQSWVNLEKEMKPYPNTTEIDATQAMVEQGYNALAMFNLSDKFFTDLGLIPMPQEFWDGSVIEKPDDREIVCHASAWDFSNGVDFRIKQCTVVTMEDLVTVHHEMGHIEYFLQYKDQPQVFREGANPGFHEAIGDLLALSVSTPKHLKKIGLLGEEVPTDDNETTLNYQMRMALDKIAFFPFGYIMDLWRWDVFSGTTNSRDLNRRWWELRLKYQGVSPPVKRSENDFDPGAKYHIPAGVEYIRYFVSHILQFSFHKSLCDIAEPGVPLYQCDIDGNAEAGAKLGEVLKLGSSLSWPEQLNMLTGNETMSAAAMIEYFQPLIEYLDEAIAGETIGWQANVNDYFEDVPELTTAIQTETTAASLPDTTAAQLPDSTAADLPDSTAANLPDSTAANLPDSTAANLPDSTAADLPDATATDLPETTTKAGAISNSSAAHWLTLVVCAVAAIIFSEFTSTLTMRAYKPPTTIAQ